MRLLRLPSGCLRRKCCWQRSLPKCIGCVGKSATDVAKKRIVPDINVFISGLLWTGIPHRLLEAAEAGTLTFITTAAILEETQEVLVRPKFAARIAALSTDNKILACAVASGARWVISGDPHLLDVKRYRNVRIVTPREFWDSWARG